MDRKKLLEICMYFLQLEERARLECRPKLANFARRQYWRYRCKLAQKRQPSCQTTAI